MVLFVLNTIRVEVLEECNAGRENLLQTSKTRNMPIARHLSNALDHGERAHRDHHIPYLIRKKAV